MRVRVIALGQAAAGDDGVGPAVLACLRAGGVPADVELRTLDDPSVLVDVLQTPVPVVLVDAVLGEPAGRVVDVEPAALGARSASCVSTHGIDAGRAIALASAVAPEAVTPSLRIVGVTIARPAMGRTGMSPAVAAAVPEAAARVRALVGG